MAGLLEWCYQWFCLSFKCVSKFIAVLQPYSSQLLTFHCFPCEDGHVLLTLWRWLCVKASLNIEWWLWSCEFGSGLHLSKPSCVYIYVYIYIHPYIYICTYSQLKFGHTNGLWSITWRLRTWRQTYHHVNLTQHPFLDFFHFLSRKTPKFTKEFPSLHVEPLKPWKN